MMFVNLTPHPIVLRAADGTDTTLPPSGAVARVTSVPGTVEAREGFPVPVSTAPVFGEVTGLPEPTPGTAFVVSGLVLGRCPGRSDVFGPGTGPADGAVRNEQGQIIAVTRLIAAPAA